jgi:ADP-ribose pyrophosphatase YjhB (NUDIX family)
VKRYSFCPVCGKELPPAARPAGIVRLHACASCGFEFWQNSKPAVGALIARDNSSGPEVLLARRGIDPYKDFWDVPGGYLENGEHPPEGLVREMREELQARVKVHELVDAEIDEYPREDVAEEARFVLSLYYRCELVSEGPLVPGDDVVEARWFPLSALPERLAFRSNRRALALLRSFVSH